MSADMPQRLRLADCMHLSPDELRVMIADQRRKRDHVARRAEQMRHLLALLDAVPDARTCGEAAARLGTTVDAWLAAGE